ncbi:MAG: hypothetical protein JWM76_511 [Pseudonocardiales bacterium]|nr:hypothetical protein [Pseudonocardiales bacterium]
MVNHPTTNGGSSAGSAVLTHPAVDLVTERTVLVLSQRQIVGLSSWLVDALVESARGERTLVIVTPPTSRLTLALRTMVSDGFVGWAVRSNGSFYDGLRGVPLTFDGVAFSDAGDQAVPIFLDNEPPQCWQLLVTASVEHRAAVQTRLGGALEQLAGELTGVAPTGWGVHEPISQPWDCASLTTLARRRMPDETRFNVVGAGVIATLQADRTDRGVEENFLALVDVGTLDRPATDFVAPARAALTALANSHTLGFAMVHLRPGRTDLTSPATVEPGIVPIGMVIGPRAVRGLGRAMLEAAPIPAPRPVGNERVPGLQFDLATGGGDGWSQVADLIRHIGPARLRAAVPGWTESPLAKRSPDASGAVN